MMTELSQADQAVNNLPAMRTATITPIAIMSPYAFNFNGPK